MSADDLRVGFYKFTPFPGHPAAGPAVPASGSYQLMTIGGPRTLKQIRDEIAACELKMGWLKSEMSGHPDYRCPENGDAQG